MESEKTKLAIAVKEIRELKEDIKFLVTKVEFLARVSPLEKIVYGLIAMVLVGFMGILLSLVFKQ